MASDLMLEILKELREDVKDIKEDINEVRIIQVEQKSLITDLKKTSITNKNKIKNIEEETIPELIEDLKPKPFNWKKHITF